MSHYAQNDQRPVITFTIKRNNTALDCSTASAVYARVRLRNTTTTLFKNTLVAVTDGSDGQFQLTFTSTQLATAGEYEAQLEILWSVGVTETAMELFRFPVDAKFADPA